MLGFGGLNMFMLLGAGDESLPGLYTFRSATVGDGLLLPVLAYALVRAATPWSGWLRRDLRLVVAVAAVAALGGAALQVSWLRNPSPRLNWTLPAPHTFNLPGWYHGAFLVLACGFFAGVATALWLRTRRDTRRGLPVADRLGSLGALAVLAPGPAFLGLLLQDNNLPVAAQAFAVIGGCAFAGALTWSAMAFKDGSRIALACVASAVVALGWCGLFVPRLHDGAASILPTVAAGLAAAFTTSTLGAHSAGARLGLAAAAAVCGSGAVNAALVSNLPALPAALCAMAGSAATVAALVVVARRLLPGEHAPRRTSVLAFLAVQPLVAFGVLGAFFARTDVSNRSYAGLVSALAGVLFLALTARAVRERFDLVIDAEGVGCTAERLSTLKWAAYLAIVTGFGAALSAFLGFVLGTAASNSWIGTTQTDPSVLWRLAAALGVVLAVLVLARMARHITALRSALPVVASLAGLAWCAVLIVGLSSGYNSVVQAVLSISVAIIAGLFVAEGIVANTGVLHNVSIDWQLRIVAGTHGTAAAMTIAWLTGPALANGTGVRAFGPVMAGLSVAVTASVLMPFLAASTLPGAAPPRQFAVAKPLAGVLQDAFLVTLMAISIGWLPAFFLTHMRDVTLWAGNVLFYFAMLSAAYVYVMRNNIGHVALAPRWLVAEAERQGRAVGADERQAHSALAAHIRRQNILALVALVPLGLLVIYNEISGWDRQGLSQLVAVGPVAAQPGDAQTDGTRVGNVNEKCGATEDSPGQGAHDRTTA